MNIKTNKLKSVRSDKNRNKTPTSRRFAKYPEKRRQNIVIWRNFSLFGDFVFSCRKNFINL
ncbi:MAG TPA: hypothetical protein DHU65_06250 [Clostridiales bacterium]|nr:hypothetical protein [Clostridiales bacterium]